MSCVADCHYVYPQIARVLSGFFLIIQIILLLGFIFQINEFLVDNEHISHKIALVGATISMYACGLVIIGFMYHYYAPFASCGLNIFFITFTLIMGIAYSLFSVSPGKIKFAPCLSDSRLSPEMPGITIKIQVISQMLQNTDNHDIFTLSVY